MSRYCFKVEDWFAPKMRGFRLKCCDCGLIHDIDWRHAEGNELQMRIIRNERATAAARRNRKKKVVIVDD